MPNAKKIDIEPSVILDVYMKEMHAVLELAVPAWHSGLTRRQTADIERVQRVAVNTILSDSKTAKCDLSYSMALVTLGLEPLELRRRRLCETFAKKKHSIQDIQACFLSIQIIIKPDRVGKT